MPARRHRPGSGSAPDHALLAKVVAACPARTEPDRWSGNGPWCYGWRLFAAGFDFEAHEAWEPVWRRARPNSRERLLVQAVIQLANARLKRRGGRQRAARRLLGEAAALLDELRARGGEDPLMGVDVGALQRVVAVLNAQ